VSLAARIAAVDGGVVVPVASMIGERAVGPQQVRGLQAAVKASGLDCDVASRAAPNLLELVKNTVAAESASAVVVVAEDGARGSAVELLEQSPVPMFIVGASQPLQALRLETSAETRVPLDESTVGLIDHLRRGGVQVTVPGDPVGQTGSALSRVFRRPGSDHEGTLVAYPFAGTMDVTGDAVLMGMGRSRTSIDAPVPPASAAPAPEPA
jgi:hypothetical protein